MHTLIVELESQDKVKELTSLLSTMDYVKKVSAINKRTQLIEALQEHETMKAAIVKNKNKSISKYL